MSAPRSWQRQVLSLMGVAVIAANWRWATGHIYSLPTEKLPAFISITNNAHYVIGVIVIFALTGKTFTDWKVNSLAGILNRGGSGDTGPSTEPAKPGVEAKD